MKIITGIASTTHVDRQNDRITKSVLDGMAAQINEKYIPFLLEHDPKKVIGCIFYGEVFQLNDGEYALGVVSGIFEDTEEVLHFHAGQTNNEWEHYKKNLNVSELKQMSKDNQKDFKDANNRLNINTLQEIADLLEMHINSTQVWIDGTVYNIKGGICKERGLIIEVKPKDHDLVYPAHFHVISKQRDFDARFYLDPIKFMNMKRGEISQGVSKTIINFFKTNPDKLKKLRDEHSRLNKC